MTGPELRAWRERWQFTQSQLARALGVQPLTVTRWEGGMRPLPGYLPLALETLARRRAAEWQERINSTVTT